MSVTRYCQAGHKFIIDGEMAVGNTITVTVEPAEGYEFISWSDGDTNSTKTIYIDHCGEVYTARFSSSVTPPPTPDTYRITVSASPSNGGTVSGGGSYQSGASVTITATANTDYQFTNWTKGGTVVSSSSAYSFTATENASYVAHFSGGTPTSTTYYWKSSNNIDDIRVPISNYNQGTYTSTPTSVTAGAEGTATGFGKYTAFVVPTGKSVSGIWKDALGGNGTVTFSSNNGCYATGVPSGYTCLLGNPGTSGVSGYQSAIFTIQ